MSEPSQMKRQALIGQIGAFSSLVVAFSGGVDSSLLLAVAARETKIPLLAVTGISASLSSHQLEQAKRVASFLEVEHRLIQTEELENPQYAANPSNRCYFCKEELFAQIRHQVGAEWATIADGNNLDDCGDFRPGREAGQKAGVLSPFIEARLTKSDVRAWSRDYALETAELPASPCLSSRLATGVPVTSTALDRIERAEAEIRKLGFSDFRVRDLGGRARLEVASEEMGHLLDPRVYEAALSLLRFSGFADAKIDDRPLKSGRLNEERQ